MTVKPDYMRQGTMPRSTSGECRTGGPPEIVMERRIRDVRYEDERVLLESSNAAYDPLMISPGDIEFLHRVVWIKPSQLFLIGGKEA